MLAIRPQVKVVERIIRNETGAFVIGYFAVLEFQGKVYVKLLKTEALHTSHVKNTTAESVHFRGASCTCLPCGYESSSDLERNKATFRPIRSPFKDYTFFFSQLTRAPSVF